MLYIETWREVQLYVMGDRVGIGRMLTLNEMQSLETNGNDHSCTTCRKNRMVILALWLDPYISFGNRFEKVLTLISW